MSSSSLFHHLGRKKSAVTTSPTIPEEEDPYYPKEKLKVLVEFTTYDTDRAWRDLADLEMIKGDEKRVSQ